jgi:hypothetical protein
MSNENVFVLLGGVFVFLAYIATEIMVIKRMLKSIISGGICNKSDNNKR